MSAHPKKIRNFRSSFKPKLTTQITTTFIALIVLSVASSTWAADWHATGGTYPDAEWTGDTIASNGGLNVGALAGEGGVSGGSATYTIPIAVVPGRAGMQPAVSLSYSSGSGNGIAGVGWNLSAASSITRCGKTAAQDGATDKVHFLKSKDRLCMNGQRLIVVSGAYGNSGAEYRTEIDSFAKIEQLGDMDGTATSFTVTLSNGNKQYFGGTSDSRHSLQGLTKTSSWMLSKVADPSGNNTITYDYTDHGNGEYTLASIRYTGSGAALGDRYVEFDYEDRDDTRDGFQSGGLWVSTKRLKTISTKYQSQIVREYRLTYKYSDLSGNSLLDEAEECGFDGATAHCFPATEFDWYENAPTYKLEKLHYILANGQKSYITATSNTVNPVLPKKDMNGDGTLDWSGVFLNSEGGYDGPNNNVNLGDCAQLYYTHQTVCDNADFNQDGLTDSWDVVVTTGTTRVFQYGYANSSGTTPTMVNTPITLTTPGASGDAFLGLSDLNGDGYTDVLVRRAVVSTSTYVGYARVEVYLHTKNHSAPYTSSSHFVYDIPARLVNALWILEQSAEIVGDFDGNGIDDVFIFQHDFTDNFSTTYSAAFHTPRFRKVLLSESNTNGYTSVTKSFGENHTSYGELGNIPEYRDHAQLFDLNGDGLLDLITHFGEAYGYRINLGSGELSDEVFMLGSDLVVDKVKKGYVPLHRNDPAGGGGFPGEGSLGGFDAFLENRMAPSYVLDYDQDGIRDMLIPHDRVVSFCFDHAVLVSMPDNWQTQTLCDDEMYDVGQSLAVRQDPIPDFNDRSVFQYYKANFTTTGFDSNNVPLITVAMSPTTIVSTIATGAAADVYGNGHSDFVTMVSCVTSGSNCTFGDANGDNDLHDFLDSQGLGLSAGPYFNRNVGSYGATSTGASDYEVTDRMKSATTGLGEIVEWDFLPLNSAKAGSDFYSANQADLGSTAGYMHFSANLNVVSEVRYSDGVGGLRAFQYRYQDATLNTLGRGFQGYDRIIVDDVANGVRSVTDYHVKFPLTGEIEESRNCLISANDIECDGLPFEKNTYVWDLWRDGILRQTVADDSTDFSAHVLENTTTDNRYWVSSKLQTIKSYDTSSSHTAATYALQPMTVGSSWIHQTVNEQTYNANGCMTFSRETYEEPASANKNVTEVTINFLGADTLSWWLCKTNTRSRVVKSVTNRGSEYATIESGSDNQTTVLETILWDDTHRKPDDVTTEATQGGGSPTRVRTTYNTHGLPTSVVVEGSAYNNSSFNLDDRTTTTTYTTDGYFAYTVANSKGHTTTTDTDPVFGLPTQVTDPNGQVATMTYDVFGRIRSTKAPGEPTTYTTYWWCQVGVVWCPEYDHAEYRVLTRAVGSPDTYRYFDMFDREVHKLVRNFTNDNWDRDRRRYNERGLLNWEVTLRDGRDPTTQKFTYYSGYDNLARLTRKRTPQSNDTDLISNYSYSGHTVDINVQSSGVGAKTLNMSRQLNGLGQLVTTTDADGSVTQYAYDGAGNPIALQDAKNNDITSSFNALGQKKWVHDPNAGDKTFDYNSLGEIEREVDANGDVLTYEYDNLGRMYNRFTNGVMSGAWRYDSTAWYGRKGSIDREYNSSTTTDRLTKYYRYDTTTGGKDYLTYTAHYIHENGVVAPENKHWTYFYVDNNFGRLKGRRFSAVNVNLVYEYTSNGYLNKIKNANSGYVYREITDMDALGNATGSLIGAGVLTQDQEFHSVTGQMTQNLVTKTTGGAVVHELEYDYDGFSNLYQSVVTASNGFENYETFTYDNLQRLTQSDRAYSSESRPNDVIDYTYDEVGNILSKNDFTTGTMLYGNANRNAGGNAGPNAVRQVSLKSGGTATYTYDDAGNMLTGDGGTFVYNEFNVPTSITKGGVTSVFTYGADRQRYRQVKTGLSGGTQTTYYIDKHLEIESQGSRTTYRHYFDGIVVLSKEVTGSTTNWTMGFNLKDRLGSVVTLADHNGDVLEHRSYDPFGKPRRGDFLDAGTIQSAIALDPHPEHSSDPLTDRGFTDHEHLDEQELMHMNGRVYDYNIGRFTSVDPFIQDPTASQSINPYSYIMNNPLAGVDPSGYRAIRHQTRAGSRRISGTWNGSTPPPTTFVAQEDGVVEWFEGVAAHVEGFAGRMVAGLDEFAIRVDDYTYNNSNVFGYVTAHTVTRFVLEPVVEAANAVSEGDYSGAGYEAVAGVLKPLKATEKGLDAVDEMRLPDAKVGIDAPDGTTTGYRAVSNAELDDIAENGFRPHPNGRSMEDKWFSESREGAEAFRDKYDDLDNIVEADVPNDVLRRSHRDPNIDGIGPGFSVRPEDQPLLEPRIGD